MPPTGDYGGMYLFKLCTIHMIIPDFSSTCASDGKEQTKNAFTERTCVESR